MYKRFFKRALDVICSLLALIVFFWLYTIIAILVKLKLGNPIIFKQIRPGMKEKKTGKEKLFKLYKFRTMTDEKDEFGNLLSDEVRLTKFGAWLRSTSLDELPEAVNILKGDMSVIGPRPLLVRDMVFMDERIRMRHTVKPGLSGLAQVNGRNSVTWEQKFEWDMNYIENVSFLGDCKIVWMTAKKVLGKEESSQELDVTDDYGEALLKEGKVSRERYDFLQDKAQKMLNER